MSKSIKQSSVGSRKRRRRKKYSQGFNEMFSFFVRSSHCGLLEFCGSKIDIIFDPNADEAKYCFRKYENGEAGWNITRHPNILFHAVQGKKSYGLWVKQWSEGIAEWSFEEEEILEEFTSRGLEIPLGLMKSFDDAIDKAKLKRYEGYEK
jgi:hypothetical protein